MVIAIPFRVSIESQVSESPSPTPSLKDALVSDIRCQSPHALSLTCWRWAQLTLAQRLLAIAGAVGGAFVGQLGLWLLAGSGLCGVGAERVRPTGLDLRRVHLLSEQELSHPKLDR